MKNLLLLLAIVPNLAFGAVLSSPLGPVDESPTIAPVTPTSPATAPRVSSGGSDPWMAQQAWGATGYATARHRCDSPELWCIDISGTDYWKNKMRDTARILKSNGWITKFPQFLAWL